MAYKDAISDLEKELANMQSNKKLKKIKKNKTKKR